MIYRVAQEALTNAGRHAGADARGRGAGGPRTAAPSCTCATTARASTRRPSATAGWAWRAWPSGHAGGRRAGPALLARRGHRAHAEAAVIRVLIADDHGIVRSGLSMLIDRQADMQVVAEAEDGIEAVERALAERPDVAVLDVSMPRLTGLHAARQIRAQTDDVAGADALDARRRRLLLRGAGGRRLRLRVQARRRRRPDRRHPHGGGAATPSSARAPSRRCSSSGSRTAAPSPRDELTPRELEVVKLIAEAYTNRQIAEALQAVGEDRGVPPRQRAVQAGHARPRGAGALRDPAGAGRALAWPRGVNPGVGPWR